MSASAHWVLPNNEDLLGFDLNERDGRVTRPAGHDSVEYVLEVSNLKVTDTGEYSCEQVDEHDERDFIYVFVNDPSGNTDDPSG